jgi:hypothetical protein
MTKYLTSRLTPRPRRAAALALVVSCLALTALGCSQSIDGKKVEASITETSAQKGITLASVTCPASTPIQQGGTFTCSSKTSDGAAISWDVTQKDGAGSVDFSSTTLMDEKKLGDLVEPQLKAQAGGSIDLMCPSKWIVAAPGAKFSCEASVEGKPVTVDCTFGEGTNYSCQVNH